MSTFKEIIASDVHDIFLNTDEFSDLHTVNGVKMSVQIDDNEQIEREKRFNQNMDGIYTNQRMIYVAASDFGPLPKQGSVLTLDKRTFRVVDAIHEDGVYSITIEANRA
jgi:Mg2+/Co2+ transporter CorC